MVGIEVGSEDGVVGSTEGFVDGSTVGLDVSLTLRTKQNIIILYKRDFMELLNWKYRFHHRTVHK